MSVQGAVAGAVSSAGFERVEIDGVEYLAHDVVAQKEGVYSYPDPTGGVMREFVSTEELHEAADETDGEPILVRHPETDQGPKLTMNPRANWSEVGRWDIDKIDDGLGGRVLVRVNEIGEHDGALRRFIKKVNDFGYGEVSTGYAIGQAVPDSGRHNGMAYEAAQENITLDHLALLPDEQGDCSVEDGCGIGRANQHEETHVRVNNHIPTGRTEMPDDLFDIDEDRDNILKSIGRRVTNALGIDTTSMTDSETTSADSDEDNQPDMDDEDRINELIEEYGLSRENVPPAGSECLVRVHEAFKEQEGADETNNMADPDDPGDDPGDDGGADDGASLTDEQREEIEDLINDSTPTAEEIAEEIAPRVDGEDIDQDEVVDAAADEAAKRAEEARAHAKNVQKVAASDELPHIDEDRAERMNEEVVAELADDLEEESTESGGDGGRANRAGVPSADPTFDASQYDTEDDDRLNDIPSGPKRLGEGGDD